MKEIRLPNRLEDLRIKHFKSISTFDIENITTLEEVVKFLSVFNNVSESYILEFDKPTIMAMYDHIINVYSNFKPVRKPVESIVINNVTYNLVDPEKVATKWHIDFGIASKQLESNPVQLACLFYIPNEIYGKRDENGNMIHPISERFNDFELHFPLTLFIECCSFFLRKYQKSTQKSILKQIANQKAISKIQNAKQRLSGRNQYTH
jgi:hypothetical protein